MMLAIADDLTGAAEIAGTGLRFQLEVEITTEVQLDSYVDLQVLATDTRSETTEAAVGEISRICRKIAEPGFRKPYIYKKVDSVFRGHILPEVITQMETLGKKKALIVPANPGLHRTIEKGIYYIGGEKLHHTDFRKDPEYPVRTSDVLSLLGSAEGYDPVSLPRQSFLPDSGIFVGDVSSEKDLHWWASRLDKDTIPAGSADFFSALLRFNGHHVTKKSLKGNTPLGGKKILYVCGSAFGESRERVLQARVQGAPVSIMPEEITGEKTRDPLLFRPWIEEILALFRTGDYVIVSVHPERSYRTPGQPEILRHNMGGVVGTLLQRTVVDELIVEGGSTAAAIIQSLDITRLVPENVFGHGVIRMKVPESFGFYMTLKPGSYPWPENLWLPGFGR